MRCRRKDSSSNLAASSFNLVADDANLGGSMMSILSANALSSTGIT